MESTIESTEREIREAARETAEVNALLDLTNDELHALLTIARTAFVVCREWDQEPAESDLYDAMLELARTINDTKIHNPAVTDLLRA